MTRRIRIRHGGPASPGPGGRCPASGRRAMIYNLQILRALAAYLVFLTHFGQYAGPVLPKPDILAFGAFGVDVFFVLSGFIMFVSTDGRGESARRVPAAAGGARRAGLLARHRRSRPHRDDRPEAHRHRRTCGRNTWCSRCCSCRSRGAATSSRWSRSAGRSTTRCSSTLVFAGLMLVPTLAQRALAGGRDLPRAGASRAFAAARPLLGVLHETDRDRVRRRHRARLRLSAPPRPGPRLSDPARGGRGCRGSRPARPRRPGCRRCSTASRPNRPALSGPWSGVRPRP